MISVRTRSWPLASRVEVWFNESPSPRRVGAKSIFYQSLKQPPSGAANVKSFATLEHSLQASEDELFGRLNSSTRREIRKATDVGVSVAKLDQSEASLHYFCESYSRWLQDARGLRFSPKRFRALHSAGALAIYYSELDEEKAVFHSYLIDGSRARLLTSHNTDSNISPSFRGFANRLLHWECMLIFRSSHFRIYDFGGYNPRETPGIAKFKKSFGGAEQNYWNFTLLSPSYTLAEKILN